MPATGSFRRLVMLVALEVWSNDFDQLDGTCRVAEDLGFDALYYGESPHELNLECWTALGALAASSARIRLGPVIANILPTYRSTTLLGRQAAAVAAISSNRLDFRTGVGAAASFGRRWWEPHGVEYPDYDRRLADTRAALDELGRTWSQGPPIPITVAASGRRAMTLAAAHAQVWETSFATPEEFGERAAEMAALAANRTITRSLEIDGFLASTGPGVRGLLARVGAERGSDEDLDAVMRRALVGTPSQAGEHLGRLAEAGVDQVVVALHDPHDRDALHALAEAAAPYRDT